MQELIYRNNNGDEINLYQDSHYLFDNIDGIEKLIAEDQSAKSPRQDGETLYYSTLEKRQMTLSFAIRGTGPSRNYPDYLKARDQVLRCFHPKVNGVLTYRNGEVYRTIACKAEETPTMVIDGVHDWTKAEVILLAYDPFLYDKLESSTVIETWINGWPWKFSLPFKLRERGPQKATIVNTGHVPTPIQVEFPGPAYHPQVINKTTGEFIKVNQSLGPYDVLYLDTTFGNKKVEISREGGARENAFNYIDLDSVFFDLQIGANEIEFKCDDADLVPQEVRIRYRNRYLGV